MKRPDETDLARLEWLVGSDREGRPAEGWSATEVHEFTPEAWDRLTEPLGLTEAWAAAQAVLPKSKGRWGYSIHSLSYTTGGWQATAAGNLSGEWLEGYGATPSEALRSLAAIASDSCPDCGTLRAADGFCACGDGPTRIES